MPTRNVVLTEQQEGLVGNLASEGRYPFAKTTSPLAVVRAQSSEPFSKLRNNTIYEQLLVITQSRTIKSQPAKIGKVVSVPDRLIDRPILQLTSDFLDTRAHQLLVFSAPAGLYTTQQQRLLKASQNASEKLLGSCRAAQIEILHTIKARID